MTLKGLRQAVSGWPDGTRNVRRPVTTAARYAKVRATAEHVMMTAYVDGKRKRVRSYLPELLDLAMYTGRRLSSILNLRYADYDPDAEDEHGQHLPHGALTWRAEHDKQGRASVSALNKGAQDAVERLRQIRPGIGDAPMFPSRDNPMRPLSRHVADSWLRKADKLAKVAPQDGTLWHGYRRSWATARMHLPPALVAAAGGWASSRTMEKCYQHATLSGMLEVVQHDAEVREKNA